MDCIFIFTEKATIMKKFPVYFFASLMLFLSTFNGSAQEHPEIRPLEIGEKAPFFNLPGVDGNYHSLNDFDNAKILVVIFTCNHCPTAQAYEDKIINLTSDYRDSGVAVVAILPNDDAALSLAECGYSDLDDSFESMKVRAKDKHFNFPYLYDGKDEEVSMNYGPQATPHAFVFDKDRKLRYRGRIDDTENPYVEPGKRDLRNALDQMLAGNEVTVKTTKTFGCSIKWAWKNEWTKKLIEDWAKEPVSVQSVNADSIRTIVANEGGKLRMVNVWATWCGPCVIEFPELVNTYRMYNGRDFEFVSISADKPDRLDKVEAFLKDHQASNPNYIFASDDNYRMIEAVDEEWQGSLPYTLIIKPGGEIIYKHSGGIDPLEVRKVIIGYLGRYYADDK